MRSIDQPLIAQPVDYLTIESGLMHDFSSASFNANPLSISMRAQLTSDYSTSAAQRQITME